MLVPLGKCCFYIMNGLSMQVSKYNTYIRKKTYEIDIDVTSV